MQTPESIAAAVSQGLVQPSDIISNISDPLYAQAFQVLLGDATNEPSQDSIMLNSINPTTEAGSTSATIVSAEKQAEESNEADDIFDSMMLDNEISIDSMLDPTLFSSDSSRDPSFGDGSFNGGNFNDGSFLDNSFNTSSFMNSSFNDSSLNDSSLNDSSLIDSSFNDSSFNNTSFLLGMHDTSFAFDKGFASSWNALPFQTRLPEAPAPTEAEKSLTLDPEVINGGNVQTGDIKSSSIPTPSPTSSPLSEQVGESSSAASQTAPQQSPQVNARRRAIPGGKGKKKAATSSPRTPPTTPKKRKASTKPESPARAQARYEANLAKIAQSRRELLDGNQLTLSQMPIATPGDVILPPRDYRLWERRFKAESGPYVSEAAFRASTAATLIPIDFEVVEVPVAETAKKHPELDKDTNISFGNPRYAATIPTLQRLDLNKYRNLPLFTSLGQQVFVKPAEYDRAMARKTFADVLRANVAFAC